MHRSSLTHQKGPLLHPVARSTPFRPATAPHPKSRRALQRRLISASAFQDLTHVVQSSPIVTGTVAAAGEGPMHMSLACTLQVLISCNCPQSLVDLLRCFGRPLRLLAWLKARSQALRHRLPRQLPSPVKMQSLCLGLLAGLALKSSHRCEPLWMSLSIYCIFRTGIKVPC